MKSHTNVDRKGKNVARLNKLYNKNMYASKVDKNRKKTGGRKKGTPNKKTVEFINALGSFDPVKRLIELCSRTEDETLEAKICLEMLKYIYPQRKAVEVAMDQDSTPTIKINGIKI